MADRSTKRFLAEYYHDGGTWGVDIYAYDWADAEVRCKKLSLRLLGEHMMTIPAVGPNWMVDGICRIRNWFHNLGGAHG